MFRHLPVCLCSFLFAFRYLHHKPLKQNKSRTKRRSLVNRKHLTHSQVLSFFSVRDLTRVSLRCGQIADKTFLWVEKQMLNSAVAYLTFLSWQAVAASFLKKTIKPKNGYITLRCSRFTWLYAKKIQSPIAVTSLRESAIRKYLPWRIDIHVI